MFMHFSRYSGEQLKSEQILGRVIRLVVTVYGEFGGVGFADDGSQFYETDSIKIYMSSIKSGFMLMTRTPLDTVGFVVLACALEVAFEGTHAVADCTYKGVTLGDLTPSELSNLFEGGEEEYLDMWMKDVAPVLERVGNVFGF